MRRIFRYTTFLSCLCLAACSPSSHSDFVYESDRICKRLIKDLKGIEHSQDLAASQARLEKDFSDLADLIIEAKKVQLENPDLFLQEILECPSSELLRQELVRVYAIEGGRDMVQKAEREALSRLERFHLKQKAQP